MNGFAEDEERARELHRLDPEAERRQVERTQRVPGRARRRRGSGRARRGQRASQPATENLLPPMREALRARCTVGEICDALREEWGTYDSH